MVLLNYISFLCGFLLFLLATYLLVTKNGNRFLNQLVSLVMIARGYQLLLYTLADSGLLADYPYFVRLFDPIVYISPAAFYLYFKGFIKDKVKLDPYEWLHVLPIVFGVADLIFWLGSSPEFKTEVIHQMVQHKSVLFEGKFGIMPTITGYFIRNALFLTYLFFSWRVFIRSGIWKDYSANAWTIKWILCLLIISTSGQLVFFISLIKSYSNHFANIGAIKYAIQISINLNLLLLLVVFLEPRFLFGYLLLSRSKEEFNKRLHSKMGDSLLPQSNNTLMEEQQQIDSSNTGELESIARTRKMVVNSQQENLYLKALSVYMEEEKPFLQTNFKVSHLSQRLDIPLHHCTYLLNYSLQKNFTDWVNEYRINHFLELYKQKSGLMTIEALALESGFSNRRTFGRAFSKIHGTVPSEFLAAGLK